MLIKISLNIKRYEKTFTCVKNYKCIALIAQRSESDRGHRSSLPIPLANSTSIILQAEGGSGREITNTTFAVTAEITTTTGATTEKPTLNFEENCEGYVCIRKCCGKGEFKGVKCLKNASLEWRPTFATTINNSELKILYKPNWKFLPKSYFCHEIPNYELQNDGYLFDTDRAEYYSHHFYCMDNKLDVEEQTIKEFVVICYDREWKKYIRRITDSIHLFALITSTVFTLAIVVLYVMSPAKKDLQSKCTISCCVSLFLGLSLTSINFSKAAHSIGAYPAACVVLAVLQQFFLLCFYFWLNVMCFEIARIMRGTVKLLSFKDLMKPWYRLVCYCFYAFGGPLIISAITIIFQYLPPEKLTAIITPQIGESYCWFKPRSTSLFVFPIISGNRSALLIYSLVRRGCFSEKTCLGHFDATV